MAGVDIGNSDGKLSILFLSPAWQCDGYGIATINRSLINDMKGVDPDGEGVRMACAVLQEEGKINQKDIDDGMESNVTVVGAKVPRRRKSTKPDISWLDEYPTTYYRHVIAANIPDFIVGHVPYVANGAFNLKDYCDEIGHSAKIVLVMHSLPRNETGDIDESLLMVWLQGANVVLSVGKSMNTVIQDYLFSLEGPLPRHEMYIPGCPVDLLALTRGKREEPIKGPQHIAVITGERKDLEVKGINFNLAVGASVKASSRVHDNALRENVVTTDFWTVGSRTEEKKEWERHYDTIQDEVSSNDKRLAFMYKTMKDRNEFKNILKRTSLSIHPLRNDSGLFGIEALMSAYAGVPILVSQNSGVADLLHDALAPESVLPIKGAIMKDTDVWSTQIFRKIMNANDAEAEAGALRKSLLLSTKIAKSRCNSMNTIIGEYVFIVLPVSLSIRVRT